MEEEKIKKLILSLSPLERNLLPFLRRGEQETGTAKKLSSQSGIKLVSVKRALKFLGNKGIVNLTTKKKKLVKLDFNGILYLKKGLPERRLLDLILNLSNGKKSIKIEDAKKNSDLTNNEFTAALGTLKEKKIIEIKASKINLLISKEESAKKFPEEKFLELLPLEFEKLTSEQRDILKKLLPRKSIIRYDEEIILSFNITDIGKEVILKSSRFKKELIEQLNPEMIKKATWRGKQFRRYDITTKVPEIVGGRRQFYYLFLENIREKLAALGFKEIKGPMIVNEFWNFDALFQPQFHAAREWTDTYAITNKIKLPQNLSINKKILESVKKIHEKKWDYKWNKEKAMSFILRPQGTVLSALALSKKPKIGKYFAIARCFRPDVLDATHLLEFNQMEGFIVGEDLNFKHLLGMLKEFAIEVAGAEKVKFFPDYYPFTEPSVQLSAKHPEMGWVEFAGAGMFRPEMLENLGIKGQAIAWGMGIDRLAMFKLGIKDIRYLFAEDLGYLRNAKGVLI